MDLRINLIIEGDIILAMLLVYLNGNHDETKASFTSWLRLQAAMYGESIGVEMDDLSLYFEEFDEAKRLFAKWFPDESYMGLRIISKY